MNKVKGALPIFAFLFAAFAAVAFTSPKVSSGEFGRQGTVWYDVTGINPDEDTYVCDEDPSQNCLFDAPNDLANPISTEMDKVFVVQNASNLVIVEP